MSSDLSFAEKAAAFIGPLSMQAALTKIMVDNQIKINQEKQKEEAIQATVNQYYKEGWTSLEAFAKAIDQNINKEAILAEIKKHGSEANAEQIKNIAFYEKEIADLKEKEKELIGTELSDTQRQIELESQKLELLKNQFAIERDRANSAQLKNMSNRNMGVKGLGLAALGLPPSEDLDKVKASVDAAKASLDKMVTNAPSYGNMWHIAFDEQAIKQFTQTLHAGIVGMVSDLAEGLGSLAAGATTSQQIFAALLSGVGTMAIQLGQLAIGVGIGLAAIDEALTSLNPAVALAAGIALVALGAAVKGAAAHIAKGGSGSSVSSTRPSVNSYRDNSQVMVVGSVKISGQDIWIAFSNYKGNSNYTKIG
jgi:phosphopantetheinyl transferase (holo-ACP synthase)